MTNIFEVTHRDAAARIGKLSLDGGLSTPAIIQPWKKDGFIVDSGSLWGKTAIPEKTQEKIIILPHKSAPLHTREEIVKGLADSVSSDETLLNTDELEAHTGLVVHPLYQQLPESDLYVLGAAKQLENNPRAFVDSIINIRENTKSGSILYVPSLSKPENLAMIVYIGADLVDDTLPVIKGYQDIYLTTSGEFHLDRMHEFPCPCDVCSAAVPEKLLKLPKKQRAELLSRHNSFALSSELSAVREQVRAGSLREYVERQCRTRPWLTAVLRLLDSEYSFIEKRTPVFRSATLYANTSESMNRVEIKRFAERVLERYTPPDLDTLVLLPCSAKKPYSVSLSHQKFINALGKYRKFVHEVIITSPMGIVPRELELMYPAAHYDTPVTGDWDAEERAWVGGCLKSYLQKNKYTNIIAHVEGAYREICESVEEETGIGFVYTVDDGVLARTSLNNLKDAVFGLDNGKKRSGDETKLDIMRVAADYQFGKGAGRMLVPGDGIVRAPYPKYQLFSEKKQLATLIPQYGTLALTIEGGMMLRDWQGYSVTIGDFIPRSTILAPGVIEADPQIRPNDEVIVKGDKIFGVGRAAMSGWEMKESARGVAVELRHSKKIG
ncbi:MAG: DUF5591 domain-containing protein [Candidatus Methanoperedenaceae archaeon]|nr:DUF5591 domain-containing protein [Candidatus Methanoperedenaceae archaeon]